MYTYIYILIIGYFSILTYSSHFKDKEIETLRGYATMPFVKLISTQLSTLVPKEWSKRRV